MPVDLMPVYQLFDPAKKLEGPTLRYFVERDRESLEEIVQELSAAKNKFQALFVGQRGSGKSSELRRLASMVEEYLEPVQQRYLVRGAPRARRLRARGLQKEARAVFTSPPRIHVR